MLIRIARKEFTDMVRDGRFRWTAGIIGGMLIVSVAAGFTAHRSARIDRDAAQAQMQSWWYKQPPKNAHSAAHYGLWAFKPAPALGFVDRGVDPYTGTAAWLEAHRQNDFRFRPAVDAAAAQRFGEWTAASVLQQLIPLLIIVLAFGAFAGERELGTLRQLASAGVAPRKLIAGKAMGIAAALALILIPAALLGAALLTFGTGARDSGRFVLLAVLYLGWFGVVLATTLAVSLTASSARGALLTLLGLWAFNGLLAPRLASALARGIHPTPSRVQFAASVDKGLANGLDGHSPAKARSEALEKTLLAKYGVNTRAELPINFAAAVMQASEEHGNEVFDANFVPLYDTYKAQSNVQQWTALAAPLMAVRLLSMGISGTDVEQHRSFATAAEEYRRGIQREMNGWLEHNTRDTETFSVRADSSLWNQVPPFSYEAPSVASVLAQYIPGMVLLAAWLIGLVTWLSTRKKLAVA